MYKKLQFHNHQNLGYVTLTQPLQKDYDTESTWITMPENVVKVYRSLLQPKPHGRAGAEQSFRRNAVCNQKRGDDGDNDGA